MRPKKEREDQLKPARRLAEMNKLPITAFSALPVFRLLEINFAGGSSLGDYPLLQESAPLWEISFSFTCTLKRTSFRNFPAHSRTETNSWLVIGRRDYLFFLLIFLSKKLARSIEDSAWKDCNRRYSCSKRNYLLSKVPSKING